MTAKTPVRPELVWPRARPYRLPPETAAAEQRNFGCLLGGAYGDSLGAAVEFATSEQIRQRYGPGGISRLEPVFGRAGNVTDDTQMAIATAEGIRFASHYESLISTQNSLWQSYKHWHRTQTDPENSRHPGMTCMSALDHDDWMEVDNDSAGCGGIMRAHPIGLAFSDSQRAYSTAVESAALTHHHPNGYIPAGFLGSLICDLARGADFDQALDTTKQLVAGQADSQSTLAAVDRALAADTQKDSFEVIDNQVGGGGGWLGHDALAIAVFAVSRAGTDPLESVRVAVNHGGDSDSTGSIAGAIAGTIHGPEAFIETLNQQAVDLEHAQKLGNLAISLARTRKNN